MTLLASLPVGAVLVDKPFEDEFPADFPTLDQLEVVTLDGKKVPGEELLGQAVAIVVFLPSCPKCTNKLPKIEAARKTFEAEGITVIAICSENEPSAFQSFARSHDYDWLWATNNSDIKHKLKSSRTFEIFLFDRAGEIAFQIKQTDAQWKLHFELGLGAVTERALDLTEVEPGYTGSLVCGMCHQPEYQQWLETKHSKSYESLIEGKASQNLECIACHVTGEAGKEVRPWRLLQKKLQEVGCEECHGPGGPHRLQEHPDKALYSLEEASCVRCHDEKNSPNWNYADYLKKVAHSPSDEAEEAEEAEEGEGKNGG